MFPGDAEGPQTHQNILSNNDSRNRNVDESSVAHCHCQTHHERFICNGIDKRSQPASLVEVTSNIAVCEVKNASKSER